MDSAVSNVLMGGTNEREAEKSSLAPHSYVYIGAFYPTFPHGNEGRRQCGRYSSRLPRRRAADTHAACKIAVVSKKATARRKRVISHLWTCEFPADTFEISRCHVGCSWEKVESDGFIILAEIGFTVIVIVVALNETMENVNAALNSMLRL